MFTILLTLTVMALCAAGAGQAWKWATKNSSSLSFDDFLIGTCILLFSSSAISIIAPLGAVVGYSIIIPLSLIGCFVFFHSIKKCHLDAALITAIFLAVALYTVWPLATLQWSNVYDTNLYHFQQIRWIKEHGTPLGLANLHIRFGTISSFHTLAALFEQGYTESRSAWFMPSVFILLCWAWILVTIKRSFSSKEHVVLTCYSIALIPFVFLKTRGAIPSLYYDDAVGLLQLIIIGECIRLYSTISNQTWEKKNIVQNIYILSATAITIKLSSAMVAIGGVLFTFLYTNSQSIPLPAAILSSLIFAAHFTKTTLLTGWTLFPLPFGHLPVEWAVPKGKPLSEQTIHAEAMQTVLGHYQIVGAWARLPGRDYVEAVTMGAQRWFPGWYENFKKTEQFWILILSSMLFTLQVFFHKKRIKDALILYCMLGIAPVFYWFYTAPDMRFGDATFWGLLCLNALLIVPYKKGKHAVALITCFALVYTAWKVQGHFLHKPLEQLIAIGYAPKRQIQKIKLPNGTEIKIPLDNHSDQCGNARLPCTPYLQNNLRMERKNGRFIKFWLENPGKLS